MQGSAVDLLRVSPTKLKSVPLREPKTNLLGQEVVISTVEPEDRKTQ